MNSKTASQPLPDASIESVARLLERYRRVRNRTEQICQPLSPEDCVVQSMTDASPARWHLAHTTWFFETFVLKAVDPDHPSFEPAFEYLFNSYYNAVGAQFPRARRGLLSRPSLADVYFYRQAVDEQMFALFDRCPDEFVATWPVLELGLHHEQQHQELIVTDIKHMLSLNPLYPVYEEQEAITVVDAPPQEWIAGAEGVRTIGHEGPGFAFDNEQPRHETLLQPHEIAMRLVTCGEYLEFIAAGGYRRPELWLSLGWQTVCDEGWRAPLYWLEVDGTWQQFTLSGLRPVSPAEPVCHVSYFEAEAFARWHGARLPTEAEWETAAAEICPITGNFLDSQVLHPLPCSTDSSGGIHQLFGDVWEWTASPYTPYPGYRPPEGAIGEYNGKFMCNQYVLRGGSCATPRDHIRATYRNFFPPAARWQFTGIRLAR